MNFEPRDALRDNNLCSSYADENSSPDRSALTIKTESLGQIEKLKNEHDSEAAISSMPSKAGWKRRTGIIARFSGVQLVIQIISALIGFFLVRVMTQQEFAYYTLANTIQGTLALVSDAGVTSAVISIGGLIWQDSNRLGQLINTALDFRYRLCILGSLVIAPILWWIVREQGASPLYAVCISLLVILSVYIQLTCGVLVVVPRLHGRSAELQKIDLAVVLIRFLLTGIVWLYHISAAAVLIISTLGLIWQNYFTRRWANADADLLASTNPTDREAIKRMVKQVGPESLYGCFQSQISIFLVALLGNSHAVASVGALGRLTIIFTILGSVMSTIILPRFARTQNPHQLKSLYYQIVLAHILFGAAFTLATALAPHFFLWILGKSYQNLQHELVYVSFSSSVYAVASALHGMNLARGWVKNIWINIPISLLSQAMLIPILNLSTIEGALLFSSIPTLLTAIFHFSCGQVFLRNFAQSQEGSSSSG